MPDPRSDQSGFVQTDPPAPATEAPRTTRLVEARLASLLAHHGDRLGADALQRIRADLVRTVALADRLREVHLTNADEPGTVFIPYRGEDRP